MSYKSDRNGMRELAQSPAVGDAALAGARSIASAANSAGRSTYEAQRATVRAGWGNEERAGAKVTETESDFWDVRNRVLVTVTERMKR